MTDSNTFEAWNAALDAYERALDEHARALEVVGGDHAPASVLAFSPPELDRAIPTALRARAESLLRRTDELVSRATVLADARRPTTSASRPRRDRSSFAVPSFDRRG